MTQAFKYALIQTLCIADSKDDGDGTTAEADAALDVPRLPPGFNTAEEQSERYGTLRDRVARLDPSDRESYVAWRESQGIVFPYTLAQCVAIESELDRIVDEAIRRVEQGEGPQEAASGPEGSSGTPAAPEPLSDDQGGQEGDRTPLPDPGLLDECTAAVAELTPPQVKAELTEAGLVTTGSVKDQRARLAVHLALNASPRSDD